MILCSRGPLLGFANGLLWGIGNLMAAVGFMYGAYQIKKELDDSEFELGGQTYNCNSDIPGQDNPSYPCSYTPGDMLVALFSLQIGAEGLGLIEPSLSAFSKARAAAFR